MQRTVELYKWLVAILATKFGAATLRAFLPVLSIFALTLPVALAADSSDPELSSFSLDQAVEIGLKRSEDVQVAAKELERADAQIREAWAAAMPKLDASVSVNRFLEVPKFQMPNGTGGFTSVPAKKDWDVAMGIQLSQVVWAFGRVGNALDLAKVSKSLRELGLEAARRELRQQIILSYYGVKTAQDVVKAAEESLANAQANKRSLESRFQGGRAPRYDNIRMASDIASRKPILIDAKKQLDLAYLRLNLLLKLPVDARPELTTEPDTNFESFSLTALMDKAEAQDVYLKQTRGAIEVAEAQLKLQKAQRLPMIVATGSANRTGTGDSLDIPSEDYSNSLGVGLALTIPLWEGGAHSARQKQAKVGVQQAELKHQKYRQDLRLQLESALLSYRSNIERYKSAQEALELAGESYRLTRTRFASGGATQSDLNQAELQLTSFKIQLKSTLLSIHQDKAQLQKAVEEVSTL